MTILAGDRVMSFAADSRWPRVQWLTLAVIALVIAVGAARLVQWSGQTQVSFDGAMNLEVARSLAEGHGYRRMYADHSGFSHEIQSRAPYILPAAGVFAAFGVGVWQSQLTNLLYVAALALVVFWLVRRATSWRWALVAIAVCLWTPGIREIAMNGYGEVPALAWWLGALLVLWPRDDAPIGNARLFAAGVLAGTAVLTKTVLAIGLIAMLPLVLPTLIARGFRVRSLVAGACVFAVGIALPAFLYELAHFAAIGDVGRWRAWFHDEMRAIHMQAGTADGFRDTHGVGAKLQVHSGLLADNLGLPVPLLAAWMVGSLALAFFGRRWLPTSRARGVVFALVLFAAIYFLWWLGFTPTEKAWYRRIFNAVLAMQIMLVVMLGACWRFRRTASDPLRAASLVACLLLVALEVPVLATDAFFDDTSDVASASDLDDDLAALKRVPADAQVYGAGWYSAPILALYSGRHLGNIVTRTPAELAAESPAYLALDPPALKSGIAQYWLDRFAHREIAHTDGLHIVEIDARTALDPFASVPIDDAAVLGRVDFHAGEYPYLFGFQNREGDGWRWATADSAVLLRYGGEPEFFIDIYLPKLTGYRFKRDVGVTAWIDGCRLGTVRQDEARRERWFLPMLACPLEAGHRVTVRLVSDNLYESRDDRQLGYIVHALGFAESEPGNSTDQR